MSSTHVFCFVFFFLECSFYSCQASDGPRPQWSSTDCSLLRSSSHLHPPNQISPSPQASYRSKLKCNFLLLISRHYPARTKQNTLIQLSHGQGGEDNSHPSSLPSFKPSRKCNCWSLFLCFSPDSPETDWQGLHMQIIQGAEAKISILGMS